MKQNSHIEVDNLEPPQLEREQFSDGSIFGQTELDDPKIVDGTVDLSPVNEATNKLATQLKNIQQAAKKLFHKQFLKFKNSRNLKV